MLCSIAGAIGAPPPAVGGSALLPSTSQKSQCTLTESDVETTAPPLIRKGEHLTERKMETDLQYAHPTATVYNTGADMSSNTFKCDVRWHENDAIPEDMYVALPSHALCGATGTTACGSKHTSACQQCLQVWCRDKLVDEPGIGSELQDNICTSTDPILVRVRDECPA